MEIHRAYRQDADYHNDTDEKFWAFEPKPGRTIERERFYPDNLKKLAELSFFGVAQDPITALDRMREAACAPRESSEGYEYRDDHSFVKTMPNRQPVTVLTFLPVSPERPRSWLIEEFIGEDAEPTIHRLELLLPINSMTGEPDQAERVRLTDFVHNLHPTVPASGSW